MNDGKFFASTNRTVVVLERTGARWFISEPDGSGRREVDEEYLTHAVTNIRPYDERDIELFW